MLDSHLPTADFTFIVDNLLKCDKIEPESRQNVGPNMTTFVLKGKHKPMHKRHIYVTHENGQVNFNQASAHAINYQFMGKLLEWFQAERNWKEGAYLVNDIETEGKTVEAETTETETEE